MACGGAAGIVGATVAGERFAGGVLAVGLRLTTESRPRFWGVGTVTDCPQSLHLPIRPADSAETRMGRLQCGQENSIIDMVLG